MKKLILIFCFVVFFFSCSREVVITKPVEVPGDTVIVPGEDVIVVVGRKPLTKNIPSLDKYRLSRTSVYTPGGEEPSETMYYTLLERLYSTVWFKSEKDKDDGIITNKTDFIFFDKKSRMCRRDYDKGIVDGNDDYSDLKVLFSVDTSTNLYGGGNNDRNAVLVENTFIDNNEPRYEGYFLTEIKNEVYLFVVSGNNYNQVAIDLTNIRYTQGSNESWSNKYILSKISK